MKEDIVPFEIAKKLKEKGYPQNTRYAYQMEGDCYFKDGRFYSDGVCADTRDCYTAPNIHQVLKWLRKERGIFILVDVRTNLEWYYEVWNIKGKLSVLGNVPYNKNNLYEQAAIAGIEYVVENLI